MGYSSWGHKALDMTEQLTLSPFISDNAQCLSLFTWLISPCVIPSRFFHAITDGRISYFFLNWKIFFYVYKTLYIYILYIHSIFFIHSSVNGYLDYFHILWIMLQWTQEYRHLFKIKTLFPLGIYADVYIWVYCWNKLCFLRAVWAILFPLYIRILVLKLNLV